MMAAQSSKTLGHTIFPITHGLISPQILSQHHVLIMDLHMIQRKKTLSYSEELQQAQFIFQTPGYTHIPIKQESSSRFAPATIITAREKHLWVQPTPQQATLLSSQ